MIDHCPNRYVRVGKPADRWWSAGKPGRCERMPLRFQPQKSAPPTFQAGRTRSYAIAENKINMTFLAARRPLPDLRGDPAGKSQVALSVDLGYVGVGMSQNDLCSF